MPCYELFYEPFVRKAVQAAFPAVTHRSNADKRQMLENDTIAATICQQPKIQGSKPLSLLFAYLTTGETPEKEYNYTAVDIRIKENL